MSLSALPLIEPCLIFRNIGRVNASDRQPLIFLNHIFNMRQVEFLRAVFVQLVIFRFIVDDILKLRVIRSEAVTAAKTVLYDLFYLI